MPLLNSWISSLKMPLPNFKIKFFPYSAWTRSGTDSIAGGSARSLSFAHELCLNSWTCGGFTPDLTWTWLCRSDGFGLWLSGVLVLFLQANPWISWAKQGTQDNLPLISLSLSQTPPLWEQDPSLVVVAIVSFSLYTQPDNFDLSADTAYFAKTSVSVVDLHRIYLFRFLSIFHYTCKDMITWTMICCKSYGQFCTCKAPKASLF